MRNRSPAAPGAERAGVGAPGQPLPPGLPPFRQSRKRGGAAGTQISTLSPVLQQPVGKSRQRPSWRCSRNSPATHPPTFGVSPGTCSSARRPRSAWVWEAPSSLPRIGRQPLLLLPTWETASLLFPAVPTPGFARSKWRRFPP